MICTLSGSQQKELRCSKRIDNHNLQTRIKSQWSVCFILLCSGIGAMPFCGSSFLEAPARRPHLWPHALWWRGKQDRELVGDAAVDFDILSFSKRV